jgi:8-oxo-dGTP diphosphatase
MPYTYQYPRPAVTVDNLIFKKSGGKRQILLIQRGTEPFKGMWALPGGFVGIEEPLEQAASRELEEETGLTGIALTQFRTYGDPGRDPRHRTISVVFYGFVDDDQFNIPVAGDDAAQAKWFDISALPPLAFDHKRIIREAIESLPLA